MITVFRASTSFSKQCLIFNKKLQKRAVWEHMELQIMIMITNID